MLEEIYRVRREKGGADLLDQLLWRLKILGGTVDLADGAMREAFSEVLDAYAPEKHELILNPAAACRATLEGGGGIDLTGYLISGGNITAELERRLHLGGRWADHRRFRVQPKFRGNRIAPRSLIRSVDLYTALGFEYVHLRACFSGTWYWAQWGFHFENEGDMRNVQNHAQEIADVFGAGLDTSTLTHPIQFARLGELATISFDELADALPQRRDAYEDLAYENGLGVHDSVPFGRIVLLTGPSWDGRLDLHGADKLIFDDRAARVLAAHAEGGDG